DTPDYRKGVPQGRHLHGLLLRGEQVLTDYFPDLVAGVVADGAVRLDMVTELFWHHFGGWKARSSSVGKVETLFLSRPMLEQHVRRRVLALPNVKVLEGTEVSSLSTDAGRGAVRGVVHHRVGGSGDETLDADLVVDASGRGTRLPAWLEGMG